MLLNLGCGSDIREGYVNIDSRPLDGVDLVWDIAQIPWPIEADSVKHIVAQDIFEHIIDLIPVMDECWRVMAPGGLLSIRGPHAGSITWADDVSHVRAFTPRSFNHFDPETEWGKLYAYGTGKWQISSIVDTGIQVAFGLRPRGK